MRSKPTLRLASGMTTGSRTRPISELFFRAIALIGFFVLPVQAGWALQPDKLFARPLGDWLRELTVYRDGAALAIRWRTVSEISLIGFDVYCAVPGAAWRRVNRELIVAAQTETGGTYEVTDPAAVPEDTCDCRIVAWDNDLNAHDSVQFGVRIATAQPKTDQVQVPSYSPVDVLGPAPELRMGASGSDAAAGEPGRVRMVTREAGLHRVTSQALSALTGQPILELQERIRNGQYALVHRGHPVAFIPAPTGEDFVFYAQALRNNYTEENVYWLVDGANLQVPAADAGAPVPANNGTYRALLDMEIDSTARYDLAADPDEDYWFWDRLVATHPLLGQITLPFVVDGLARVGNAARVRVRLKGGTAVEHLITVMVNECTQPEWQATWHGKQSLELSIEVPLSCLVDGTNELKLKAFGASLSQVYLDGFTFEYGRYLKAVNNALEFATEGQEIVSVEGFSGAGIRVVDVSDPAHPRMLQNATVDMVEESYRVSFVPVASAHRYAVFSESAVLPQPAIQVRSLAGLADPTRRADMVVIAPAGFLPTVLPLVAHRRKQGLEAEAVSIESIYDEFNDGLCEPEAIRGFLRYARVHWAKAPRYALLAGNGTYDYRNLRGHGDNLVPTLMTPTLSGLFASDTAFGDVEGNAAPEMSVGRLPARSTAELDAMIQKIITYELRGTLSPPVALLVADAPDQAGDFVKDIQTVATELADNYQERVAHPGCVNDVRQEMLNGLRDGADLLCYIGHGAIDRLGGSGYLKATDVPTLANSARLPVVLAMTCLAGQFSVPGNDCLSELLLLAPITGAIAVVSPTGLSYNEEAVALNLELVRSLQDRQRSRLGDCVVDAMVHYNAGGRRLTPSAIYGIVGDPATLYAGALASPPTLEIRTAEDGAVLVSVSGVLGQAHSLWASSRISAPLIQWLNLTNWVMDAKSFTINDASAREFRRRFYRVTTGP